MNILDIALIGVGLSMDAFAVSISNGMVYRGLTRSRQAAMPIFFGGFQILMPLLGYSVGSLFAEWIDRYAGILILLILGFIGGKMIWDGFHDDGEECTQTSADNLSWKVLFLQAIATSIDAFAVGVGFSAVGVAVVPASLLIGLVTFTLCWVAIAIGKAFGALLEDKAQIVGGIILVLIGVKNFLA